MDIYPSKTHGFDTGAFIHPPEPCKGCFITVRVFYFKSSEQDPADIRLVPL